MEPKGWEDAKARLWQEARDQLRKFREQPDFSRDVVQPLFERMGLRCTDTHNQLERKHKCDLIMESQPDDPFPRCFGAQLKVRKNISTAMHVEEIDRAAHRALNFRLGQCRLSKFYWITTGSIERLGRVHLDEAIERWANDRRDVEVWDVSRLARELGANAPYLVPALMLLEIRRKIDHHRNLAEGVFAAYHCFEAFEWHFRQEQVDVARALEYAELGRSLLAGDERRELFYWRVLDTQLALWQELIRCDRRLFPELGSPNGLEALPWDALEAALRARSPQGAWWLLRDLQLIAGQLDLLERIYVPAPAGLSSLQACQLLLRAGRPATSAGIERSLAGVEEELRHNRGCSIDGGCSLCTGVAVSVLSLAGAERRSGAATAVEWLSTLGPQRFSVRERSAQHALHYASMVLEGAVDYQYPARDLADEVLDVILPLPPANVAGLYDDWMKHRNIPAADVATFIVPALLRYWFNGGSLQPRREAILACIERLMTDLEADAGFAGNDVETMYAVQSNVGSLVLGAILGSGRASDLLDRVAKKLHAEVRQRAYRATGAERLLWDSSADRTRSLIEGYLQYWEAAMTPSAGLPSGAPKPS